MIDIFDRQVQFVLLAFGRATIFCAAVGQHPLQRYPVLVEKRDYPIVKQVRRHQWSLAIVQLGEGQFRIGIERCLLIYATHALKWIT